MGITVAALSATDSNAEPMAKALNSLASSDTKDFPVFPYGTLK